MALSRLQALELYLEKCKPLNNFKDILHEQCLQVVKELENLEKMDFGEGAPLLACVQQNTFWTADQKELLSQAIHAKVKQSMVGKTVVSRIPMQQFQHFPMYLMDSDWSSILSDGINVQHKCDIVMERLYGLGLRAPSEDTLAMLTVVLLLRDSQRLSDGIQLRSAYLSVKQMVKNFFKGMKTSSDTTLVASDVVEKLPSDPKALQEEKLHKAYPAGKGPAQCLPSGVEMEYLLRLMSMVPQRSNSRTISMQLPKASGQQLVDPNMMLAQQMATQMFISSMGGFQQFGRLPLNQAVGHFDGSGFQASGTSSSSRPAPAPLPVPSPLALPSSVPTQGPQVEVEVVQATSTTSTNSPTKAPLAIKDAPATTVESEDPSKQAAANLNIKDVNQKLEDCLAARDQDKKEKKEVQAHKESQVDKKNVGKTASQKKPAKADDKKKSSPMKKPSAAPANASKRAKDTGATLAVEHPVKKHRKGPLPTEKVRLKWRPDGCSKCRWRAGCTNSCWIGRGYGTD